MKSLKILILFVSLLPVFSSVKAKVIHCHNKHHRHHVHHSHPNNHKRHCHKHCRSSRWHVGFDFFPGRPSSRYVSHRHYYPERRVVKRHSYERRSTYRRFGREKVYEREIVYNEPVYEYETVEYEPAIYVDHIVEYREPNPIRLMTDFAGAILDIVD